MLARSRRDAREDEAQALNGLLVAAGQGDRNALAELHARTCPRLLAVVVRMLHRPEAAEEVLHDAYLRIWHNAANFVPARGPALTWMMAIARGTALERLRRHRREVPLDELPDYGPTQDDRPDPLASLETSDDGKALAAALAALEAGQRDCLLLAYYHGLTYEELAKGLEQPAGSVKSWIGRALLQLRQRLGGRDSGQAEAEQRTRSGEYVLGLLTGEERDRFERRAMSDARLRALVDDWQRHLAPLAAAVAPVDPPPALWQRLETTLAAPTALRQRPPLSDARRPERWWRGTGLWRAWAILATLVALALAAWILIPR
jgi:RNA polymerase sigma-70 factor (ECF subfamily)